MNKTLLGSASRKEGKINVSAEISKDDDGTIELVTKLSLGHFRGTAIESKTNDRQVFRFKANGDVSFSTSVDDPIVARFMPRKNGHGNNPALYEMFDTAYKGLLERSDALGLGVLLEERSVMELVKASDRIRMYGKKIGVETGLPQVVR
jgi:hypothetical protein